MVALVIDEDLRLVVQPAEGGRMQDAVAVAPIGRAGRARGLIVEPAPASARIGGIGRERGKSGPRRLFPSPSPPRSIDKPVRHPMFQERLATPEMSEPSITLSARAAQRIVELLKSEAAATLFRVSVEGGGCSGFQYRFDLVKERAPDDLLIERDGARVVVDPVSLGFVHGVRDRLRRRADRRPVQDQQPQRHRVLRLRHQLLGLSFPSLLAFRHGRACPGHPRIDLMHRRKSWMPGTRPGMTKSEFGCKSAPMKIATWNINGIKARIDAALTWLKSGDPRHRLPARDQMRRRGFPELRVRGARL